MSNLIEIIDGKGYNIQNAGGAAMNQMVSNYFNQLRGKKVAVLGIGVSNRPLIEMLLSFGIETIACDRICRRDVDEEVLDFEKRGITLKLGVDYLDRLDADVVFRTPGMHPNIPALCRLREAGAVITSEMESFFAVCPCTIIAVTGSDGKTTTTTLISEILKKAGKRVWVGGNIGQPLLPVADQMRQGDFAVVELSSFQLMNMKQSPHVAVITNLAPNHLDVHKDMAEYVEAKENIYLHQCSADALVLNYDNEITASFAPKARAGSVKFFSRRNKNINGAYLSEDAIWINDRRIVRCDEILLPGVHNIENYMAAICATSEYASADDIRYVAKNFGGVEHRIEFIRTVRGVRYYNDSIASSPTRTIAGLHAFDRKIILIAGGYDKQIPFDDLGPEIVDHVKRLILCGATADKIKSAVVQSKNYCEGMPLIVYTSCLEDAVRDAYDNSEEGDIVSLSPACAAFDQYKNFMVRGTVFKELVNSLGE